MGVLRCCHRRFTPEFNLLSDTGSVEPSGLIGTDNVGLRSVRAASEELRAFTGTVRSKYCLQTRLHAVTSAQDWPHRCTRTTISLIVLPVFAEPPSPLPPTWPVSDFILIRSVIIARASGGENSSRGAH